MNKSLSKARGFTLIELIVVIVILGIMAAIAGPKFIDLQTDARISVIQGVEGGARSAATLVYSKALIDGVETSAANVNVNVSGGTVQTIFGYPTLAGMADAMEIAGDVTYDTGTGIFTLRTGCTVTYTAATGVATPATISVPDTSGC